MATFNKFQPFVEAVAEKKHNLGTDQLKLFMTNSAPTAGMAVLTEITEISYTFASTRNITTSSSAQSSGTYKLTLADLTITASLGVVGPFRYVGVYNDTATNDDLINWYDYGASITLLDGETLLVDFDASGGFITLV